MKRILLLLWCLVATSGCVAQIPTVYIDNLVVQNSLKFTNPFSADVGFYLENPSLIYTNSEGPGWMKFNKDGVLYLSSIRVLGVGSGAMVGDGSGLTNIMGTNIVGAVAESSHATNADIAVSASNATNLWGQITTTNLPPGVLTNNWNGPTVVITNSSLVVTGAQYFAVSNGASRFLVTNGSFIATLRSSVRSTLDVWGALDLNNSSGASRAVIRASDEDGRINVSNGNEDSSPNFIFGPRGSAGGANANVGSQTNWPGFSVSQATNNPTLRLQAGNATNMPASLIVSGGLFVTNGIYYSATSNGVVSTNVIQPLHTWASIAITNAGTYVTLPLANTYTTITNWQYVVTNQFKADLPSGFLTNTIAGFYSLYFSVSCTPANSDQVEADVAINGVPTDIVAAHWSTSNPAKDCNGSGSSVMYLAANTQLSLQIKNINSTTLAITHAQLKIGPP